ncbi:ethylene-responsive transcription factor ERF027-like [Humulus lupulus]|uniref:ethylene-responsive transcription factor ERF027-like n=1 Tax=Humulus lupulus TaxID=3486 RepID=UPI002B40A833|nr:ethylene-responsive transcription factor ERF027-like [Humulus lupulus]
MANPPTDVPKTDQPPNPSISLVLSQSEVRPISENQPPSPAVAVAVAGLIPSEDPPPQNPFHSPRTGSSSVKKHPFFRGIRCRSGKWVSEIREPRKTTRVWLGTYPTPEMAAAAYDVAALALKGHDTALNFPNLVSSYPVPASTSATDIRAAAAKAAESKQHQQQAELKPKLKENKDGGDQSLKSVPGWVVNEESCSSGANNNSELSSGGDGGSEFMDEEALLNMPNLLVNMAEGMLVSPPRINTPSSDDSAGNSDGGECLWSYT